MTAEPAIDLGSRWVAAWAHARNKAAEQVDDWPLVHVLEASRDTEMVCFDPGPAVFADLMRHIRARPRAMLTVIAQDIGPYAELALPTGVRVDRDDETLMCTTLHAASTPPIPTGLTPRWGVTDRLAAYVLESEGRIAAEGTVGIHGVDAVFDAVETMPSFQRRGLGRHVVAELTRYAVEAGATAGILAATGQGRRLYEALGWQPTLAMRSLMGVAQEA